MGLGSTHKRSFSFGFLTATRLDIYSVRVLTRSVTFSRSSRCSSSFSRDCIAIGIFLKFILTCGTVGSTSRCSIPGSGPTVLLSKTSAYVAKSYFKSDVVSVVVCGLQESCAVCSCLTVRTWLRCTLISPSRFVAPARNREVAALLSRGFSLLLL